MTRPLGLGAALSAAALLLAGCGSASPASDDAVGPTKAASPSAAARDCAAATTSLTRADLDGDGTADEIDLLTSKGGACPDRLSAAGGAGVDLAAGEPPVGSAFAVTVPGRQGQLVVTRQDHPRGGFQLRVFGQADGRLVELTAAGRSLVPFVALDVQEHPWSIDCAPGGLVFTEAVAHEPRGFAAAWDIRRTTYAVDGTTVTAGSPREIDDNVLPGRLATAYPTLVRHAAFASCRTA